jgi:CubicO group peptidase (beta-lactamase class C family)
METQLREITDTFYNKHYFSGTCLAKQGNTTIFSAAYGMAHKGFHIPNTMDTKFDTASVTKVFTATVILMLIERGKLSFDDKIVELLDLNGTEIPMDVTVEHLLTHTSGIADDADEEDGEIYSDLFIKKPNYSIRNTVDFLPQFIYKKPLFKAGTNIRYNNCAFILLGLVIEKLADTDYRTFITEKILTPCGLNNTVFCAMDEINENTAEGYFRYSDQNRNFTKWSKNIYSYPPIGSPDSGIYSTVGDLDIFIRSLKAGKLLSKRYTELIFQPHCTYTRPLKWNVIPSATIRNGYAFEFIEINDSIFCMRKDGVNKGVGAMLSFYPEVDISMVILANQDCNIWEMNRQFQNVLFNTYYVR